MLLESLQGSFSGEFFVELALVLILRRPRPSVDMPSPKNLRELQSFIGRLSYIRRFLPQLAEKLLPLFQLTKKSQRFQWTAEAQSAFDLVKKDLLEPRVLMPPQQGKPVDIVYVDDGEIARCVTCSRRRIRPSEASLLSQPHIERA